MKSLTSEEVPSTSETHRSNKDQYQFNCRNCGGGDRGRVAIYRPFGEFHRAKIALSPVWCSRPTTGVPLAHATMNFVGLDLFTPDSVAAEFRIAHSIVSRLWRQFQTTGADIRGSVVVVHEEPHPQMTGTLFYRPEETGCRQREKSLDTRHRRLDDRYRVLPWPEDCTVVVCLHDALYEESRLSLSSDSHRILIWRKQGSRNHPSNIIERDKYGGRGVLVWGGIMLGSRTDLHIFDAGSVNGTRYCNEILLPFVRFLEALWVCSSFSWTTMHHVIAQLLPNSS
ncbi:transposable element Tcb1 transposase [Trichonephila clavipes]|uniref:Transposable element Tcb1 transposase n=1 Tax=Trichonephila clavipes TaxID=2585209 RepID=A0A8X6S2K1_TRICX|nr:transposable element Tcb1 transposase [Trichonephila clavipes]